LKEAKPKEIATVIIGMWTVRGCFRALSPSTFHSSQFGKFWVFFQLFSSLKEVFKEWIPIFLPHQESKYLAKDSSG